MKIILSFAFLFFISPAYAANNMYGLFMVVKGDIKVTNLKNQTAPVKVGSKILPGETVVSGADSRAKIVMADRNVFNISPSTKFVISSYENDPKAGTKNVELSLLDGKVRSNVEQKYDGEKSKFLIKTPTAVAGVRGTQFLVSFDAATKLTQVVTLKGSVEFSTLSASGQASKAVTVKKGETTTAGSETQAPEAPKAMPKEELKQIDTESSAQTGGKVQEPVPVAGETPPTKTDKNLKSDRVREGAGDGLPKPPPSMIDKGDIGSGVTKGPLLDVPTAGPGPGLPNAPPVPKPPMNALPPPLPSNVPINNPKTKVKIIPVKQ